MAEIGDYRHYCATCGREVPVQFSLAREHADDLGIECAGTGRRADAVRRPPGDAKIEPPMKKPQVRPRKLDLGPDTGRDGGIGGPSAGLPGLGGRH